MGTIFYELVEGSDEEVLTPEYFVESMVHFARAKFNQESGSIPDHLARLFEENLIPHACKDVDSFFWREAYRTDVRAVMEEHNEELRSIFNLYAALDQSGDGAAKLQTMNITEF